MSRIAPKVFSFKTASALEPKKAQVQVGPKAQIQQALALLKQASSQMDVSGQDPNQAFLRIERAIKELEETLKQF